MKNIKNITTYSLLLVIGVSFFSCKQDFNEVNTDPIGKSSTTANQLLAPALVNVLNANMVRNRNVNNELMQVTVDINDSEGRVFRYDIRNNLADYTWNNWYTNNTDLRDIYTIASQPETLNKSYQGISLITQTWVYSMLTDMYGDVPYSEANRGWIDNKPGIAEPAFDKQKDIYLDMFKKLEEANELLKEGTTIVATSDPVYQGDVSKWRRFGNSLYLRLLLRVAGKTDVAAATIAKIKEMVDTNPTNYPVMQNNDHTAKILWNGTNSSSAVYSSPFMVSVRAVDFRGPAITDFFLDRLVSWNDPRTRPALGKNSVPRFGIGQGPSGYTGVPSGYAAGSGVVKQAYFYSDAQTNNPTTLQTDPYTGIMMNSAEVAFIKAEAALRGWISGPVEAYYYKGMLDGITYWLPTFANSPTDAAFVQYITDADIMWDNTLPLDDLTPGNNSKLEMIHIQKYFAMFLVDMQQWYEYRRTGHPILPKGPGLANGGRMPARLNYPVVVQSTNPTSYKNAVAAQGPDNINT
ncbi:MAG: SusD/RagB family nutrient-binding outer membrane lipoprotein, partial [Flavobacteriales bacterium]